MRKKHHEKRQSHRNYKLLNSYNVLSTMRYQTEMILTAVLYTGVSAIKPARITVLSAIINNYRFILSMSIGSRDCNRSNSILIMSVFKEHTERRVATQLILVNSK